MRTEKASVVDSDQIRTIIAELSAGDPVTREHARQALVLIGKPAVSHLIGALSSPDGHLRWEAAYALSRIRDPSSAGALTSALQDEVPGVRWLASEALVAIGKASLVPLLEALLHSADSVHLRQGAGHVLRSLGREMHIEELEPVLRALESSAADVALPVAAFNALRHL